MPEQLITLEPDPPTQGGTVKVCYDFTQHRGSVTLRVTFPGVTSGEDHVVDPENPCVMVDVPDNATSIKVEDRTCGSPDKVAPVLPA